MRVADNGAPVYRLKVTLKRLRPPIWRRFLVPADVKLKRLHDVLQAVMGWSDTHGYEFVAGGLLYGPYVSEVGQPYGSEGRTSLARVLRQPGDRIVYVYDHGDAWVHDILLEAITLPRPDVHYPLIEKGRRACPPEDVGGFYGYGAFLEAISDPRDPEHRSWLEWIGGDFDSESFDVDRANRAVRGLP